MFIEFSTLIRFESSSKTMIQESIDILWLDAVANNITSIKNLQGIVLLDNNRTNVGEINEFAWFSTHQNKFVKKWLVAREILGLGLFKNEIKENSSNDDHDWERYYIQ